MQRPCRDSWTGLNFGPAADQVTVLHDRARGVAAWAAPSLREGGKGLKVDLTPGNGLFGHPLGSYLSTYVDYPPTEFSPERLAPPHLNWPPPPQPSMWLCLLIAAARGSMSPGIGSRRWDIFCDVNLCCCPFKQRGRPQRRQQPQAHSASRQARATRPARKLALWASTPDRARVGLAGRTPYPPHARAPEWRAYAQFDRLTLPFRPSGDPLQN